MIKVECSRCHMELQELGGLAFSPPEYEDDVTKYHLCFHCWEDFEEWLSE